MGSFSAQATQQKGHVGPELQALCLQTLSPGAAQPHHIGNQEPGTGVLVLGSCPALDRLGSMELRKLPILSTEGLVSRSPPIPSRSTARGFQGNPTTFQSTFFCLFEIQSI